MAVGSEGKSSLCPSQKDRHQDIPPSPVAPLPLSLPGEATPFPQGTQFLLALSLPLPTSPPLGSLSRRAETLCALVGCAVGPNCGLELTALWPWPSHMTKGESQSLNTTGTAQALARENGSPANNREDPAEGAATRPLSVHLHLYTVETFSRSLVRHLGLRGGRGWR